MYRAISVALLALGVVSAAYAAGDISARTVPTKPSGVVVGADVGNESAPTYDTPPPPAHSKIAGNFSRYTKGKYICCFGYSVAGGASHQWLAVPFTPSTSATVKTVEVAISYRSGTNAAVITLNSDSGGVPGTALATFHVSSLPAFGATGTCCTVTTVTSAAGVAVTGGHTYWVVVMTDGGSVTFNGTWHSNEINQTSAQTGAVNQTGTWQSTSYKPGLAFTVLGN